jgi:hypothetical protein
MSSKKILSFCSINSNIITKNKPNQIKGKTTILKKSNSSQTVKYTEIKKNFQSSEELIETGLYDKSEKCVISQIESKKYSSY